MNCCYLVNMTTNQTVQLVNKMFLDYQGTDPNELKKRRSLGFALIDAIQYKKYNWIPKLLELGADLSTINSSGENALFLAVKQQNEEIINLLLKHANKNPEIMNPALNYAIEKSNLKLVNLLLENGADPFYSDETLRTAFQIGNDQIIAALLGN